MLRNGGALAVAGGFNIAMSEASIAAGLPPRRELRIDRVFGRSFSVLGNRLPRYFLLSALPGLPSLLAGVSAALFPRSLDTNEWAANVLSLPGAGNLTALLLLAFGLLAILGVFLLVFTLVYVAMIYGVFQDMRGQPFRLAEGLGRGLGRFWPLVGLWICAGLATIAGLVLLIVPGVMLIVMWWVAAPACVLEQLGPIRSLERSAELTRGNRWRVVAIILAITVASSMGGAIIAAVPTLLELPVAAAVLSYVWNTVTTAYHLIATVVAYHELRFAREGIDAGSIASVFD